MRLWHDRPGDGAQASPGILLVLGVLALMLVLVLLHTPWLNGPPYVDWDYRRLTPWIYPRMALALGPLLLGQWLHWQRGATRAGLLLLMLASFILELASLGSQQEPYSLLRVVRIVREPELTSYFFEGVRFLDMLPAVGVRGWFENFPDLLEGMRQHARYRAPGALLYYAMFMHLVGSEGGAALLGGLVLGLLATLGVVATYDLVRVVTGDRRAAFSAASYFSVLPSLTVFFPECDQVYPALGALAAALWVRALEKRRSAHAVAFGAVFAVALFFSYIFLQLGVFLLGWLLVALVRRRLQLREGAIAVLLALAGLVLFYLPLWSTTGFDPVATFLKAYHVHAKDLLQLRRPAYPGHVPFDVLDFVLGSGWAALPLTVLWWWPQREETKRLLAPVVLCLLQVSIPLLAGRLPGETARLSLYLYPFFMVLVGLELARWPPAARTITLVALWLVTAVLAQNMLFVL
ncbi:MAG: glycosyltransferase family 39 protein [Pseudomonadota bacterium]